MLIQQGRLATEINETTFGQGSSIPFYTWSFQGIVRTYNKGFPSPCFSDWSFTFYGVLGGGW